MYGGTCYPKCYQPPSSWTIWTIDRMYGPSFGLQSVKNVPDEYYGMDWNFCYWDVSNIHLHVMSHHSAPVSKCVSTKRVIGNRWFSPRLWYLRCKRTGVTIEMDPWFAYHLELLYWYNPHGTIPPCRPAKLASHCLLFLGNDRCLGPCSRRRQNRMCSQSVYLTAMSPFGGPCSRQNTFFRQIGEMIFKVHHTGSTSNCSSAQKKKN